jgi:putative ABC transport system permease protein
MVAIGAQQAVRIPLSHVPAGRTRANLRRPAIVYSASWATMGTLVQDLRYALRTLRKTPAFLLAAIATLAIGIGATTAIFSTVNAALLNPLPYPASGDLYSLRTALTDGRVTTGNLSPVEIIRLNDPSLSIVRAAGLLGQDVTLLRNDGTPLKTRAYGVSEGFFELFGLPMTLGGFGSAPPAENAPPTVVLSHRIWQDLYGGDPAVVGKPLRFAEITTAVGGVAPRDFDTPHGANFWFQIPLDPKGVNHSFEGFMRVEPGTTIERARSELAGVMASVARDFPESARSRVYVVGPLVESIVGELGPILIVVLSATGVLLLLACVNVTNLLLARGAVRAREMAVRVALGAGRGRIVRQLLTESILLASAGTAVGVLAAYVFVRLLLAAGASELPRLDAVPFDGRVLLFVLAVLFVSGVLVGFAPALRLAATDVRTLLNESGRSSSGGRGTARWLGAMTVAQVALAVTLVAGAGWLVRSFDNLRTTDPGFSADGRYVFDVSLIGPKFRDNAAAQTALDGLLDRLRGLSGVVAAASTFNLPLRAGPENSLFVHLQGDPMDQAHTFNSRQRWVTPGFFAAMGVTLLAGRDFHADDRPGHTPVAIVNRTFARRYLSGKDPLAVRFTAGYPAIDPRTEWSIIGIVEDVRQKSLSVPGEPAYYTSHGQGTPRRQAVVVHTSMADSPAMRSTIRDEARKLDPNMAIDVERVTDIVGTTLNRQQLGMTLMLWFGAAAVALAAVGIYGVIAYGAAQRQGEVAIRLALGATQGNVFWLVLRQGRTMAGVGAAIGLVVAYLSGRIVSSRLYDVRASDPMVLGAAAALVVGIALLATVIPAYRAARLDPARVLWPE